MSLDAPFEAGVPNELKKKFFFSGSVRRTEESMITAAKFIPKATEIEVVGTCRLFGSREIDDDWDTL